MQNALLTGGISQINQGGFSGLEIEYTKLHEYVKKRKKYLLRGFE